ncbi:MAG: cytochrome c oxidase subunit II [Spirochaetia bacterium]|nr:cytochrome c oxidase subunit II [Spirochaetia bacterium]
MNFLPEAYSTVAPGISELFNLIFGLTTFWFIVAYGAAFYGIFTSLKTKGGKAKYITGESFSESKLVWIVVILVIACDFWIDIKTAHQWSSVEIEADMPKGDMDIKIVGRQFQWEFVYPGKDGKLFTEDDVGVADGNDGELVLPIGKVTKLHITSADVLHAFFVRQFGFKQDAIPGRVLTRWVQPTKEGRIELTCAEICGPNHGTMRNWVKIVSQDEFDKYVKSLNSNKVAMLTPLGE